MILYESSSIINFPYVNKCVCVCVCVCVLACTPLVLRTNSCYIQAYDRLSNLLFTAAPFITHLLTCFFNVASCRRHQYLFLSSCVLFVRLSSLLSQLEHISVRIKHFFFCW